MKTETRFIIYTNDAILLTLARFPLSITGWDTLSQSQQSIYVIEEREEYQLTSKITNTIKSKSKESELVLPIDQKLFNMPPGFTPKISELICIGDKGRTFKFKRITVHPKFNLDPSHLEVIEAIVKVWKNGYTYINEVFKEIPKAKKFHPKHKRNSILQLERVDGDADKAQNVNFLWDLFDQIIQGGNDYARTPICDVVERTMVSRNQWEYRSFTDRQGAHDVRIKEAII